MQIVLYSFSKRENSTKRPDSGTTVNGNLRADSGILSPAIEFATGNPAAYNYAYIPDWNRYYWITEWTYTGGLWLASMRVDALASWRDRIGDSTQYVVRSSAASNGAIIDGLYPGTSDVEVVFDETESPWDASAPSYMVGIIGKSANGAVTYYNMTAAQFAELGRLMLDEEYWSTNLEAVTISELKTNFNPIQYITSVTAVPFAASGFASDTIAFGWWDLALSAGIAPGERDFLFTLPIRKHPQSAARGSFLNASRYTSYMCHVPGFGSFPINADDVVDMSVVFIQVAYDPKSSTAKMYCRKTAGGAILYSSNAFFGAPVQIAQLGMQPLGELAPVLGIAGAVASTLTGNIGGIVGSINDGAAASMPQLVTSGINGSLCEFFHNPQIVATFRKIVDEDNEDRGRPLCERRQISTLPGYLVVADGDIALPATAEENSAIKSYMEGGFFFE